MDDRKHLVLLALGKGLEVVGEVALESRDVDRVGASDGGRALSGVHGLDVWLRVVGVELRDTDGREAGHVDGLVGVDGHLWGCALVSGRHAGCELRLDAVVASPEVGLTSLVARGNGGDSGDCSSDQSQWASCDGLSKAEGSDDSNGGGGE